MGTHDYAVEVASDFLERQTKATPVQAIAELIWNSLDADATHVDVELVADPLGGLGQVVVSDNGHGIPLGEAPDLFAKLGGSWKHQGARTKTLSRMLHGQEGRGRFKALSLGRSVDWKVVYRGNSDKFATYNISILEDNIRSVSISDDKAIDAPNSGVTVIVSELRQHFPSLNSENSLQDFAEVFAIYLKNYSGVQIRISGEPIDPGIVIAGATEHLLAPIKGEDGTEYVVNLEIIEWRRPTKRALYLCNEQGFPLSQVETRFHVGDFQFSAYLKSPYISALHKENRLDLAEMDQRLAQTLEEARNRLKDHFRERAAEKARAVVEDWKTTEVYPFEGDASTHIEKAERQIFDIVAVTVQETSPEFESLPKPQKALHLRMLRHAIERSPQELQRIFDEVLKLPKRKQKELAALLDEASLTGIITAASVVADRLRFLAGLEAILFDHDLKKRLKERSQLHKIVEGYTWLFGEEYNLWVSDRSLTEVLRQHRDKLDPSIVIDEPVKHVTQERGILDLMFSRAQRKHRADDIEHLVIELKAPKIRLGLEELSQIEKYAVSVAKDDRFHTVKGLKWHFWLVSDSYDEMVEFRLSSSPEGTRGIVAKTGNMTIGVKTWAQIVEDNRARLQFFQQSLEHRIDKSEALAALQEKHRQFLEGVIVEESPDSEDTSPTQ
jgi:hypothetical protein